MSNNDNGRMPENRKKPAVPPKSPHRSRAGLVWLLIMIMIGVMLLFKAFSPEKQQEILAKLADNCNWDIIPFCTLEIEEDS